MPTAAELLAALPAEAHREQPATGRELERIFRTLSDRPVPTGALKRFGTLGGLSTKLGLAYTAWWVRSWYLPKDRQEKALLDTHLASALKTLETMGYLRGAVAKLGQLLTSFPETIPQEFINALSNLQFQAPPMHFALVREQLFSQLGDPEDIFADFDTQAIAAASIGQVHRARLKSGEEVAVKIQYPGIARTIRADLRGLRSLMRPFLYSEDWRSVEGLFDELRTGLESETDYGQEAQNIREVARMFDDDSQIIVPRVHERFSTDRVLTMDFVEGRTFDDFLATNPSQDVRDEYGRLISLALYRPYRRQLLYNDAHPGNFLFMNNGRLGFIDFGNVRRFSDEEWGFQTAVHDLRFSDDVARIRRLCAESALMTETEQEKHAEVVDVIVAWLHHYNEPLMFDGKFDYGDPGYLQRGSELLQRAMKLNWVRQKPFNLFSHRLNFQLPALFYRLKSRVNVGELLRVEDERNTL